MITIADIISSNQDKKLPEAMLTVNQILGDEPQYSPNRDIESFTTLYKEKLTLVSDFFENAGIKEDELNDIQTNWIDAIAMMSNPWYHNVNQFYCMEAELIAYLFFIFARTGWITIAIFGIVSLLSNILIYIKNRTDEENTIWLSSRGKLILAMINSLKTKWANKKDADETINKQIELFRLQTKKHDRFISPFQDMYLKGISNPNKTMFVVNDFLNTQPNMKIHNRNYVNFETHITESIHTFRRFIKHYEIPIPAIKQDLANLAKVISKVRATNLEVHRNTALNWVLGYTWFVFKFSPDTLNAIMGLCLFTLISLLVGCISTVHLNPKNNVNYNRLTLLTLEAEKGSSPDDAFNQRTY